MGSSTWGEQYNLHTNVDGSISGIYTYEYEASDFWFSASDGTRSQDVYYKDRKALDELLSHTSIPVWLDGVCVNKVDNT